MMVAQRSSSLSYESLPTEEGGFPPSTASSRNATTRQLMVTHQPATRCRTHCVTASLVTMLLITATVLGVLVALAANPEGYKKMFGGRTAAHGKIGSVSGSFSDEDKHREFGWHDWGDAPDLGHSDEEKGAPAHASFSSESSSEANPHTDDEVSASTASHRTSTRTPYVVRVTTPSTTSTTTPTTTTTQSSTTTPTTTTTTTSTTTSSTVASTTSTTSTTTTPATQPQTVSTTAKPRPPLPPINIDFNVTSEEAGATKGNGSSGSHDAHMGVVDYMIVMQSKMPPGLLVTILVFTVVGAVVLLAVVACIVRKRRANTRRRAHVRQAINELRAHDKSSLLQGDEDGEI